MRQTARSACALTLTVVAWACSPLAARAADYNESTSGDLSGVAASPTPWALSPGANVLAGAAGTNFNTGVNDYDLVAFTVPVGLQLDSILATSYQNVSPFGLSFVGLQAGSPWLDGLGYGVGGGFVMGWSHFDHTAVGADLLAGMQEHANDPPFAIPLASGTYTMLIQDVDTEFDYTLTFNVTSVPEPASAALLAIGGLWLLPRGGRTSAQASGARLP